MTQAASLPQLSSLLSVQPGEAGVEVLRAFVGTPDAQGILLSREIEVPAFRDGCYYACSQKHDPLGQTNTYWPGGANRMQPLRIHDFQDLTHGGMFLLLRLTDATHLALLPIVSRAAAAYFRAEGGRLMLDVATFGQSPLDADLPLLAWARADDVYTAARLAWQTAMTHPLVGGSTQPRAAKHYPEPFTYLGWCTWEQYKFDIHETMLLEAIDDVEASGLPIRYVLVDDGHLHHQNDQLLSFEPDRQKFPSGWRRLLERRDSNRVKWFGLWLNFNGYWKAIAANNALGPLNDYLAPVNSGGLKPAGGFTASMAFYDAMIGAARDAGFDFVKVDDQAQSLQQYAGTSDPVKQTAENSQALEAACARHVDGLINCMAHNSVCIFNTRLSAVTRCSEDYKVNDAWRAKAHLHNSFANMIWCGQTVWGDHDMFHSNDPLAGRTMAISKALSGGPIYLSDDPTDFNPENVWPLCFRDGRLLRPLAPAAPLPDSIYCNPFTEKVAYRTAVPLPNRAVAVGLFNLTHPGVEVSAEVSADDYAAAAGLLQPAETWTAPEEGVVLYDWQTRTAERIVHPQRMTLAELECRLYLLLPVVQNWAVIGHVNKFLSPAGVEVRRATNEELILHPLASGEIFIWSEASEVTVDGLPVRPAGLHLWSIEVPDEYANRPLRFRRA